MSIETVNELITSLESAGELSIKERKYLELAKAYVDREAESVAQALTFDKCRELSGCPAGVDLQDWVKQLAEDNVVLKEALWWLYEVVSSGCVSIPDEKYSSVTNAAHVLLETTATDRIVAEAEARGVEKFAKKLESRGRNQDYVEIANAFAKQLREGADK